MMFAHLDATALAARADETAELGPQQLDALKLRVLDLLGCACAGFRVSSWRALADALDEPGASRIWFCGSARSIADALRVNAFMSHAAYMEDGSRSTGGHPSCVVTPTALTVAAAMRAGPPAPRVLLSAVAFGYDVFLRVGERAYPALLERGFQSTAVLAPIASAAATARLLGLDVERTTQALAIAASQGAGLKAALRASTTQPLQVAQGCEAGRVAALLAAGGANGYPEILRDGFFPAYAGGERDVPEPARTRLLDTYLKLHGGCRGNHAPLDAFLALCRDHAVGVAAIRSVGVFVDRHTLAAEIEHPITPAQAQFSIGFAIAVAAVHGETSAFAFAPQRLEDPAVQALMSRIVVQHDPVLDRDYPAKRAARVEIVTDSAVHAGQVDYPVGEPENPASSEALTRKYEELATPVLGADAVRVRDLVLDLERQASLAPLFEVLARARPSGGANDEVARRASVAA